MRRRRCFPGDLRQLMENPFPPEKKDTRLRETLRQIDTDAVESLRMGCVQGT